MPIEMTIEEEPTYLDYTFKSDYKTITGEYDADKYFRTADEIKQYISTNPIKFWNDFNDSLTLDLTNSKCVEHFINEIETDIEDNKVCRFIAEYQPLNLRSIKSLITDLSSDEHKRIERYTNEYNLLLRLSKATKQKSQNCLKDNWDEIKKYLSTFLFDKAEQAKLRLKQSQAKYYQKKKAALNVEKKPTLTAEEKAERYKEQLKKANKTYYEKKRVELLELGVMKPKQTEEEKRLAKKEANKRYYAAKTQKVEEG